MEEKRKNTMGKYQIWGADESQKNRVFSSIFSPIREGGGILGGTHQFFSTPFSISPIFSFNQTKEIHHFSPIFSSPISFLPVFSPTKQSINMLQTLWMVGSSGVGIYTRNHNCDFPSPMF